MYTAVSLSAMYIVAEHDRRVSTVNFTIVESRGQLRHVDVLTPARGACHERGVPSRCVPGRGGGARGHRPREMPSRDEGPCRVADGQSDAEVPFANRAGGTLCARCRARRLSSFPSFRARFSSGAFSEDGVKNLDARCAPYIFLLRSLKRS